MRVKPLFRIKLDPHQVCYSERIEDIFVGRLKCRSIRDGDRRKVYSFLRFIEPRLSNIGETEYPEEIYIFSVIATRSKIIEIGVDDLSRINRPKVPLRIFATVNDNVFLVKPLYETRQQLWISLLKKLKHITLYNENGKMVRRYE